MSLTGYELGAPAVDPTDPRLEPLVRACAQRRCTALVGAPVATRGGRGIATLAVDATGIRPAYLKMSLGGGEIGLFVAGERPEVLVVDGWRIGLGICKDTRISAHLDATAALGVDLYAAGLVHVPDEQAELDPRARRIATSYGVPVVFAGFAGREGGGVRRDLRWIRHLGCAWSTDPPSRRCPR